MNLPAITRKYPIQKQHVRRVLTRQGPKRIIINQGNFKLPAVKSQAFIPARTFKPVSNLESPDKDLLESYKSSMDDIRRLYKPRLGSDRFKELFTSYVRHNPDFIWHPSRDKWDLHHHYGLDLSVTEANTYPDQPQPYKVYQLSWGGPQEEFRMYPNGKIEYWLLDWGTGKSMPVTGADALIIKDIMEQIDFLGNIRRRK